jgi:hypothetical protein
MRWPPAPLPSSLRFTLYMLARRSDDGISPRAGSGQAISCGHRRRGISDITAVLPEGNLSRPYILQTVSMEIPVSKEALMEMTLGRSALHKGHRRTNPGAGCPASLRNGSWFEGPHATAGLRKGVVTASPSPNVIIPSQRWGDTGFMWDSHYAAWGFPELCRTA